MIRTCPERDIDALQGYGLVPKLLHDVHAVDASCRLLERDCDAPILPLIEGLPVRSASSLSLVEANLLLEAADTLPLELAIPLLKTSKMGDLMPKVRSLSKRDAPALALDLTVLADTPPYGSESWRPKTREDLAELRAAAGCPLWLYGVTSPADAEIAVEAGLEAIVVHSGAGFYLGGPATIDIFPDVFDTVAGMTAIYAGGPVRSGIDVFRYLAVGAEAVVADTDRSLVNLRAELEYAMRLTGCETLADISYEANFRAPFWRVVGEGTMIANIDGVVAEVRDASVVVQAGAFGLEIFAPKPTLMVCRVGEALRLHTHLVVKEDDLSLYGFHDTDMHTLFTYLISVSGIGPKVALAMLSSMADDTAGGGHFAGGTPDSWRVRRGWARKRRSGSS